MQICDVFVKLRNVIFVTVLILVRTDCAMKELSERSLTKTVFKTK